MPRGIRNWTEKLIEQRIREGYGDGEGSSYKPWIGTADFSSAGRTHRPYSSRFGRTMELNSDVEWNTFVLLEFSKKVSQLYEGFRLEREDTLQIAAALGIRHPAYPGTNVPAVMTVDFLAEINGGDQSELWAIDCKRTEDAENETAIEKLQITRQYFAGRNIPHHLVFHSKLAMAKVRNIEWARGGAIKPGEIEPQPGYFREKADLMAYELATSQRNIPLAQYCAGFESRHGLGKGDGLRIARLLIWEHTLRCNMSTPGLERTPLSSFICKPPGQPLQQASGQ
jgi:hypothetical protein